MENRADERKFVCEWSGLPITERTFIPGKRVKCGTFADVNCALAWLEEHKPRNWKGKVAQLKLAAGRTDIHLPARDGWSLEDPRRVIVSSLQQHYDEFAAHERRLQTRRKRPREESAAAAPPSSASSTALYSVEINDTSEQGKPERKVLHTANWRAALKENRYETSHAMPVHFLQNDEFVLYPLLAGDGLYLKATQCNVRVKRLR